MDTQQRELSYYSLRLIELLRNSFPDKAEDHTFIDRRSALAADAYQEAFRAGHPANQCDYIAYEVLFTGLHFSPFDTLFQVVCNEFDTLMADEDLRPFAVKLFPVCQPVFEGYHLHSEFAYSSEYDLLYTELTGTIAIWIEENGL